MSHPLLRALWLLTVLRLTVSLHAQQADPQGKPVEWMDVRRLGVEGQGWRETAAPIDRLPARAEGVVRPPVWNLSRHSA
ncbi:MAG: SGNH/GDSL hydrolase N-terminal domain-containing protein, partial [Limisphaerales bacterium]